VTLAGGAAPPGRTPTDAEAALPCKPTNASAEGASPERERSEAERSEGQKLCSANGNGRRPDDPRRSHRRSGGFSRRSGRDDARPELSPPAGGSGRASCRNRQHPGSRQAKLTRSTPPSSSTEPPSAPMSRIAAAAPRSLSSAPVITARAGSLIGATATV